MSELNQGSAPHEKHGVPVIRPVVHPVSRRGHSSVMHLTQQAAGNMYDMNPLRPSSVPPRFPVQRPSSRSSLLSRSRMPTPPPRPVVAGNTSTDSISRSSSSISLNTAMHDDDFYKGKSASKLARAEGKRKASRTASRILSCFCTSLRMRVMLLCIMSLVAMLIFGNHRVYVKTHHDMIRPSKRRGLEFVAPVHKRQGCPPRGRALFAVITRDDESSWGRLRKEIEEIGHFFTSGWSVIAVENDSKDKTRELLERWKRDAEDLPNPQHVYLPAATDPRGKLAKRGAGISYLAYLRNLYLNYQVRPDGSELGSGDVDAKTGKVRGDWEYVLEQYEYLIVVDGDMTSLNPELVHRSIQLGNDCADGRMTSRFPKFAAIAANGIHHNDLSMYDVFAFRSDVVPWPSRRGSTGARRDGDDMLCSMQIPVPARSPPFEIHSGFGGLAIYNTKYIVGDNRELCQYESVLESCEHVSFNYCVRRRAKADCAPFLLDPNMVVVNKNAESHCDEIREIISKTPWPLDCAEDGCESVLQEQVRHMARIQLPGPAGSMTRVLGPVVPMVPGSTAFNKADAGWCKWSPDADQQPRDWLPVPPSGRADTGPCAVLGDSFPMRCSMSALPQLTQLEDAKSAGNRVPVCRMTSICDGGPVHTVCFKPDSRPVVTISGRRASFNGSHASKQLPCENTSPGTYVSPSTYKSSSPVSGLLALKKARKRAQMSKADASEKKSREQSPASSSSAPSGQGGQQQQQQQQHVQEVGSSAFSSSVFSPGVAL